jgi:hypothetical protein
MKLYNLINPKYWIDFLLFMVVVIVEVVKLATKLRYLKL